MKIKIAEHYGLCFGVRDALARAEQAARTAPLTILGELVHNPVVRARMHQLGVREGSIDDLGSASTAQVMITAHGAAESARRRWREAGYAVSDTTCPLVHKAHRVLQQLVQRGGYPVVIGQRGHAEVQGLIGDFAEAAVIEDLADVEALPERPRFGVISQTTQPVEKVRRLLEAIRAAYPESQVEFVDTICQPTKNRQESLRRLLEEVEAMVVVGGKNSNNTRQLVAACEAAGRPAHHIEHPRELRAEWFAGVHVVGLTAGTSTLPETVAAVERRLEEFAQAVRDAGKAWCPEKRDSRRPAILSSSHWVAYFQKNAGRQRIIPWAAGAGVTAAERAEIGSSLSAWQLGETSDGSHLLATAQAYAGRVGDPEFAQAIALFIREEQRHGSMLGQFLDLAEIPRASSNWGDTAFRRFRYAIRSMEVWSTPVVMVETHALIYYQAIRRATSSPVLRAICAQILADEVPHLRFQCERFAFMLRGRSAGWRRVTMALHRLGFAGVTLAVWAGHRRALRAGGYGFGRFWRSSWARMRRGWNAMQPEGYAWPEPPASAR